LRHEHNLLAIGILAMIVFKQDKDSLIESNNRGSS